jgi:hypothetical protein
MMSVIVAQKPRQWLAGLIVCTAPQSTHLQRFIGSRASYPSK